MGDWEKSIKKRDLSVEFGQTKKKRRGQETKVHRAHQKKPIEALQTLLLKAGVGSSSLIE